ncbi:MAG: penicillin-binding protein 2 [Patescibacteria group bacterium]|nr:penicillin-binding protein 2 [Patescibacteria group bacterium]
MRHTRDPFILGAESSSARFHVRRYRPVDDVPVSDESAGGYLGKQLPFARLNAWRWITVGVFIILSIRTGYLQLYAGERYHEMAEGNRIRILEIGASRGMITDRFGQPLVQHAPNLQLNVVPFDLPHPSDMQSALIGELSSILQTPTTTVATTLADLSPDSYVPVSIAEDLSHRQAVQIAALSARYPGVSLNVTSRRRYLNTDILSLSHVLGYLGRIEPDAQSSAEARGYALNDQIGKSGIELSLEDVLRGQKGREEIEVDATGRRKAVLASTPPVTGSDVVLTIDAPAQQELERDLQRALSARKLARGAAIAMDPRNGEVLALVSLPAYDSNAFARGITAGELAELSDNPDHPLFNRAIQGTYPPGSTVKPVIAAAALEEGVVTEKTTFMSVGGIRVNAWYFPDWKAGGHGPTDLTLALAESVNTYFYYVGGGYQDFPGLGIERISRYLRSAGLGQLNGIELRGEADGLVPTPAWKTENRGAPWYIGDTYHVAIGEGDLLVTPLQVASFTSVVANGGTLYQPHLVRETRPSGETVGTRADPRVLGRNIFTTENLAAVRRGLRRAVQSGSANALRAVPMAVAGKTGTAQWSTVKNYHAWFTGYAPADDPRVVVTILIEEGGEGSSVAVPVAVDFFNWWVNTRQ